MRKSLVGAICASAAVAGVATPAVAAPKKPVHKVFIPHLCAWIAGSTSTLELEGGCHERAAHPKTVHTPLGSYTSTLYTAKQGVPKLELVPQHLLTVGLIHVTGASAAVNYIKNKARLKVLAGGALVVSNKSLIASWSGDTSSCKNPPTGDCTTSEVEALKGQWEVLAGVDGAPPGSPGAEETKDESNGDDAEDLAQEELLKSPTVGVALAVAGHV